MERDACSQAGQGARIVSRASKLSNEQLWEMYHRMAKGEHDISLAEDFDISRTTVAQYRAQWGFAQVRKIRVRNPVSSGSRSIRFSDAEVEKMRDELASGATLEVVAIEHGTSREYVRLIKSNAIRKGIGIDVSDVRSAQFITIRQRALLIVALRRAGFSPQGIANRSGIPVSSIQQTLSRNGITKLPYRREGIRERRAEQRRRRAKELRSRGMLQREIAGVMGVSEHTVWVWLNDYTPKVKL